MMFRSMFEDDPFFGDPFADMHRMMNASMMGNPLHSRYTAGGRRHTEPTMMMSPFRGDMFGMRSMFPSMGMGMGMGMGGMGNMMRNMELMSSDQIPGSSFQSSFTSISYGGGEPKVYQSSSSTRVGPNGIKETRKTERNSETGHQKMAIGHHIGERGHIIEKTHNSKTGDKEECQEFINLEEDEAEEFDQDWQQRSRSSAPHYRSHLSIGRHQPYNSHHRPAAIEYHQPQEHTPRSHRTPRHRDDV
uniref:myeloid leukemia factor 2 n=1 Tax=Ciona intestinalis TaxID=7719 RepID=UPI000180B9F8|nr:myeloid leukemia factor 2 [Ciona intestinalis]|eukprot:XP_026694875.1 myeloid leukemia factor 2 [Ciona intestinalis]